MERKKGWIFPAVVAALAVYACLLSALRAVPAAQASAACADVPVCVVIDAGHGGEDGGAVSADGVRESELNLAIALRVRDLLNLFGVRTRMIRTTDTAVYSSGCTSIAEKKTSDLKNRTQAVNETPNALLVSIHQNFFPEDKYHGAQVFYAATDGSEALAAQLQSALRAGVDPENHRQPKPVQGVYLMEHIGCTGVLVECGFLSNAPEAALLQQPDHQKRLAAAICGVLRQYLTEEEQNDEV